MHSAFPAGRRIALAVALLLVAGCKGIGANGSSPVVPGFTNLQRGETTFESPLKKKHKIDHIVIVIQENRSLNNLFYDYPNAQTQKSGKDSKGQMIKLQPIGLSTSWDITHNEQGYLAACDGHGPIPGTNCKMDGFDKEGWQCDTAGYPKCPIKYPPYSYVPHDEILPYLTMAQQYVLASQMYASNFDASSYVSHQYIIAGQAAQTLNYPLANWGCPGGKPDTIPWIKVNPPRKYGGTIRDCFNYETLGDELDKKGDTWAFYANPLGPPSNGAKTCGKRLLGDAYAERGIWSSYQAVKHICYSKDWDKDVFDPPSKFLTDVKGGMLRNVTWITPTCKTSDHPGCNSDQGPSWVASVVNAVGKSKFWKSTVIFIFWDDYGGFYDRFAPKYLDYDGLGIRVPLLIVSPYAKKGFVSHTRYEHGSILRFIEDRFGLAQLAASDKRANSPALDCFDFSKPPRKFVPIKSKYDESFFLHQPPDYRPPDTN